jgi:hypothetical protein
MSDYIKSVGTRAEVLHGTAAHTSGGLKKDDLKYNRWGRIVSKRASARAHKTFKHVSKKFKAQPLFKKLKHKTRRA